MSEKKHLILAYYNLISLPNPHDEVKAHKDFFRERDATGRLYISEQGINGQLSGSSDCISAYIDWMQAHPFFHGTTFKIHAHHENVFPRMTIKYRKQLVALDTPVDLSKRGEHISPRKWREMLENKKNAILIDVRNDYESRIGHFEGAELPPLESFRDFHAYAQQLQTRVDSKETPVMMYCTGGIRCELYSALLRKYGFDKIYQLEGGVINYGLEEGKKHWKGKLFVFDDRLAIPISEEKSEVISHCDHCDTSNDSYYNCANMDCNRLFLCCPSCLEKYQGCCQESCKNAERVRPYHHQNPHKPFRKRHNYFDKNPGTVQ